MSKPKGAFKLDIETAWRAIICLDPFKDSPAHVGSTSPLSP